MTSAMLVCGVLFGSIGLGYFLYGKKISNLVFRYSGLGLMFYPYLVHNTIALVAIGVGLVLLPQFLKI